MLDKNCRLAFIALVLSMATAAHAQTSLIRPSYQFPTSIPIDGPAYVQMGDSPVFVSPYVGFGAGYDDNVLLSNTNARSSTVYAVSPGLKFDARDANKVFQLGYQAQIGRYAQSTDDDYVDQTLGAQLDLALDRRNFLRLGYGYLRGHDPRGSTDRSNSTTPDRYRLSDPSVTYAFGSPGAQGRIEVYYDDAERRYLNNKATTAASDRNTQNYGGTFYWRVMPRTYVLAEARQTNIHYIQSGSPLSADEERFFGGVSWEATAATTGTIKVGNLKRRFKSDLPSESSTSWEGTITWAPRTYSKFDLYTVRTTNESTGQGNFILSSILGVSWNHAWNSLLSTGVDLRYQKDEYQGFDRTDETRSLGLKVAYRFRRWLTLGGQYVYTQRDSNVPTVEYDKNLYMLTATASM